MAVHSKAVCLFLNKRPDIIRQIEPTVLWQDFALFRVALTKSLDTFYTLMLISEQAALVSVKATC